MRASLTVFAAVLVVNTVKLYFSKIWHSLIAFLLKMLLFICDHVETIPIGADKRGVLQV